MPVRFYLFIFFLDDQNHNWTAKLNAVSFLLQTWICILDILGEPYAFPHQIAIWVVLYNMQTFSLTLGFDLMLNQLRFFCSHCIWSQI